MLDAISEYLQELWEICYIEGLQASQEPHMPEDTEAVLV